MKHYTDRRALLSAITEGAALGATVWRLPDGSYAIGEVSDADFDEADCPEGTIAVGTVWEWLTDRQELT